MAPKTCTRSAPSTSAIDFFSGISRFSRIEPPGKNLNRTGVRARRTISASRCRWSSLIFCPAHEQSITTGEAGRLG